MQIKNHDDFPKFDHRSAPSFWAERDGVIDRINWGIFIRDAGKLQSRLKSRPALKRLSILASFCQPYNYKSRVSAVAISRAVACLIEGSNGRLCRVAPRSSASRSTWSEGNRIRAWAQHGGLGLRTVMACSEAAVRPPAGAIHTLPRQQIGDPPRRASISASQACGSTSLSSAVGD